ncbi:hypothetical protein ABBQ32_002080 [Trebouxia sp. C0010 RCD-2024]
MVPGSVQSEPIREHVVQFLSSRLSDWPSVHGCLTGIAGLQAAEAVQLAPTQTAKLVKALLEVQITTLPQADRMLALTILHIALQKHGTELVVTTEVDMLQGVIASIDGEKDPRCLMLSFQLAQQTVRIYEQAAPQVCAAQHSLDANKEELVDVVACYFPISFSPPPNNVHGITRQDLAAALQDALTCTPLFAPLFIPMLLEKLSSNLRQAKLDALVALTAAAEGYGPAALQPHLSTMWVAVRAELLAPAAPALLPADLASAQQAAEKAAECLTGLITAQSRQGSDSLVNLVLADQQVCGDLLGCLSGVKQRGSEDPTLQVETLTKVAAAVAAGSLPASQMTCKHLLPPLAAAASHSPPSTGQQHQEHKPHQTQQQLALSVILAIVTAAVKAAGGAGATSSPEAMPNRRLCSRKQDAGGHDHARECEGDPMGGTGAAVLEAVIGSQRLQDHSSANPGGGGGATMPGRQSDGDAEMHDSAGWMQGNSSQQLAREMPSSNGTEHTNGGDDSEEDAVQLLQLQVLTELVSFPATSSPLSSQELQEALALVLECLRGSSSNGSAAAMQAISALTKMAGAGHAKLLEQRALAPLLTSATNISSGQGAPWRGGLPLQALAALATPASHLRLHILSSIQNLLPAMLAASISNEHNEQMLAAMLHVISHSLAPFAEEESTAAGSIGLDLVTGVAQLTLAGQVAAKEVSMACAQAVQAAVAACDASQQLHICQIACTQLHQTCRQLPHASAPNSASHASSSLHPGTGPPQGKPQQPLATSQPSEHVDSIAAQASAMPSSSGHGMEYNMHSAQQVLQLLAQSAMVSAAAVAALCAAVVPHDRAMPLLKCLVKLAMGLPEGSSQHACMIAAAAVVNKWPPGSFPLDDVMACMLKLVGIPDLAQVSANPSGPWPDNGVNPQSFTCLATILKGACMAGHKAALPLIALPLSYLQSLEGQITMSGSASANAVDAAQLTNAIPTHASRPHQAALPSGYRAGDQCCQAAAAVFELVPSTKVVGVLSLSKDMAHVIVKPLWQQRFYTAALQHLDKLLTESESPASQTPDLPSSQGHGQKGRLLLALAYLLKGTPAKISRADLSRLLRWLLMALETLQQPGLCADKFVMAHLLELVKSTIEDPTGRATVEPEVQRVISTLICLTCCKDCDLRQGSLQCLVAMMDLPYHLLHPLRKQVLAALASSIDDNKRRVRQEAVRCLKVWSST